jgi:hypothetical protein
MRSTLRAVVPLLVALGASACLFSCELIVKLDDGLVDSGPDVGIVCTICSDAPFDARADATPDHASAAEGGAMDSTGEGSNEEAAHGAESGEE